MKNPTDVLHSVTTIPLSLHLQLDFHSIARHKPICNTLTLKTLRLLFTNSFRNSFKTQLTHAALVSFLSLLPSLGISTPLLVQRQVGPGSVSCAGTRNWIIPSSSSDYAVSLDQTDPDICQGFLDNLHGICGDGVTACSCVASPTGQANMTFTVPATC